MNRGEDCGVIFPEAVRPVSDSHNVCAAYAVWPIGLAGGLLPNIGYSIYLLRRNRTGALFQIKCPHMFWAHSHGNPMDGRVCVVRNERNLSGPFRNIDLLGTLSNLHDHGRNPVRRLFLAGEGWHRIAGQTWVQDGFSLNKHLFIALVLVPA